MPIDAEGAGPSDGTGVDPVGSGFDPALAAAVNDALVGELDEGLAVDPSTPFGEERRLFAALYVRHRHSLSQHARRYLRDPRDVDEVVQETFLRLFLALPDLESEIQAIAWCRRTATNLCIDRYRAEQRRPRLVDLGLVAHELVVDDEPSDPLIQAEDAAVVRQALAMLSPLHREALVKREIEEKPLPQIAAELDIPEESVKHLLYRARRALRRALVGTDLEPASARAKALGSALLLILIMMFGLSGVRSSIFSTDQDGATSASAPTVDLRAPSADLRTPESAAPVEPAPETAAVPEVAAEPVPGPAAAVPVVPAPGAGGVAATGPESSVRTSPAPGAAAPPLAADQVPAPSDAFQTVAPAPPGEEATLESAPLADAPLDPAPEPLPVFDAFGRRFAIDGAGTLSGTGQVEQLSTQELSGGQLLAVSRFVSPTPTGDLALHQNVTEEVDGRVTLDVVPILFGDEGEQLQVQIKGTVREFARQFDGTVRVQSTLTLLIDRAVGPTAEAVAAAGLGHGRSRERTLVVEMIMSGDLRTVLSEFVKVT